MSRVFHYELEGNYLEAVSGDRCWVVDAAGTRWLDATGGAGAVTIGYGIAEIADAVARQVRGLAFAYARSFTTRAQEELADLVVAMSPAGMDLVYFVSGGSEATESAIKIAMLYHYELGDEGRTKILSRSRSYHGNTLATLGLSGRPSWREPFSAALPGLPTIPTPGRDGADDSGSGADSGAWAAAAVEQEILRQDANTVAAFIAEPIVGGTAPGLRPPDDYWPRVRQICDRYGVLLIADEVLTGFGRTGTVFAMDHWGVVPDLIACGKGISSGYAPLGAVVVSRTVADAFRRGSRRLRHSFTFAGHPTSCAAGVAALRYLADHDLVATSARLGRHLMTVAAQLSDRPGVAAVRCSGLLMGIEFRDPEGKVADFSARIVAHARGRNILVGRSPEGDQLQLLPPMTTQPRELDSVIQVIDDGVQTVWRGAKRSRRHARI